eukprot:m.77257 g.77257  ORF g.77257 m.77257 type:complete len:924 (+) comp20666_c1_seq1:99-2870(+)
MATFKKPRTYNPDLQRNQVQKKNSLNEALGLDSESEETGSESESDEEQESDGEGGISFIEYFSLQKSLRRVTEQKLELTDQLKTTRQELHRITKQFDRATTNSKMQVSILKKAQETQLEEKDSVIDNLKITIQEMEENQEGTSQKTAGIKNMVETITKLSNEKRQLFEEAKTHEHNFNTAKEDLDKIEGEWQEKYNDLQTEVKELRGQVDPVAVEKAKQPQVGGLNNEEIETLRQENAKLREELRELEDRPATVVANSKGGASSEQVAKLESELKKSNNQLRDTKDKLSDANAQVAKLKALSASGSERDKQHQEFMDKLQDELNESKKKSRELNSQVEELGANLKKEQQAHQRVQQEMKALQEALNSEKQAMQNKAAEGETAKQSIEAQLAERSRELQMKSTELAQETSKLKTARSEIEAKQEEISSLQAKMKEKEAELVSAMNEHGTALKEEKERSATVLQNTKAEHAAEIAELQQRAQDSQKDILERLKNVTSVVGPMSATLKTLSSAYKSLRKEARALQGEIGPVAKQCKRDLIKMLADVDKQYKEMLRKYRKEMTLRKKLHNELVDLKGNIRVYGRIRPTISEDGDGPDSKLVINASKEDDQLIEVLNKGRDSTYELDTVFGPSSTQEQVFGEVRDLIVSVIDGFNVCIFAYGQTGSGKTFTMEGTEANPGLNRRALSELFHVCEEKKGDWSYEIEVSVMEIYNEKLRDLLSENPKNSLDIKHGKSGPQVPGLSRQPVQNVQDVREKFDQAKALRATSSTKMNDLSSRSHAILVVYVTGTNLSTGTTSRGKLNLIDLAGSERVGKSGALDDSVRLKEANNINKSLSCLGDVIHALGAKQKHIPYRNSKLTHLLQDSLGGSAKTLMVVQIAPVEKNVSESVCSLNFAKRVRAVELGSAKKTTDSAEVAALKKQIKELTGR